MGCGPSKEVRVVSQSMTNGKVHGKRGNGRSSVNAAVDTVNPTVDPVKQTVNGRSSVNAAVDTVNPTVDPVKQTVNTVKPTVDTVKATADPVAPIIDAVSYAKVDEHARKAPKTLRSSPRELVAYLSDPFSEPKMTVRAIFVWITDNIAYDTDGYFGKCKYASCDAEDVMKGGKSVCSGYANVMERLCREAGIPVKKLLGYAKCFGSSVEKPSAIHAWNAVELGGKWYLLDVTWGAGNVYKNATFEKKFKEFYFLTDPRHLAYSHFPYMDGNIEGSMRWQLLENPATLDMFNNLVRVHPEAFILGVKPVSHTEGVIRMKNEVMLSFKCDEKDEVLYTTSLMHKQGNMLHKKPGNIFDQFENGLFTTRIHPNAAGTFDLTIYGKKSVDDGSYHGLFEYVIKCEEATGDGFSYPETYTQTKTDRCILVEPLQGKLKQNSTVNFHITSPYLNKVMINNYERFLKKSDTSFKGTIKTGSKGKSLYVYGSRNEKYSSLYRFDII